MRVLLMFTAFIMLSFDAFALSYADVCPIGKIYNWTGTEEFIRSRKCEFYGRCSIIPIEEDTWDCHSDFDSGGKSSCFYTKHIIPETDVNNCFTDDEDGDGGAGGKDDVIDLPEDWTGDIIANYDLTKLYETCNTLPFGTYRTDDEDCYRKGLINQREQLRQQSKHFAINDHQISLLVKYMQENTAVIADNATIARDSMDFQTNVINQGNKESNKLLNMINDGIANIQSSDEFPDSVVQNLSNLSSNSNSSLTHNANSDKYLKQLVSDNENGTYYDREIASGLGRSNFLLDDLRGFAGIISSDTKKTNQNLNGLKSTLRTIQFNTGDTSEYIDEFKSANVSVLNDIKGLTTGLGVDVSAQKDYQKIIADKISLLGDDFGRGIPELDKKSEINNNLLTDIKALTQDNTSSLTVENKAQLDKAFEQFDESKKQTSLLSEIKDLTSGLNSGDLDELKRLSSKLDLINESLKSNNQDGKFDSINDTLINNAELGSNEHNALIDALDSQEVANEKGLDKVADLLTVHGDGLAKPFVTFDTILIDGATDHLEKAIKIKQQTLTDFINSSSGLINFSTNFDGGQFHASTMNVKGIEVDTSVSRMLSISDIVRPIIIFMFSLFGLSIILGGKGN